MLRLKSAFRLLMGMCFSLFIISWNSETSALIGPIPSPPQYDDSTQWYVVDRHGEADLFYIISTETNDHMIGDDTCHLADTYNRKQRGQMFKEMHAVDSFYSGRLNYYSPYYRQVSIQSWTSPEKAYARLAVTLADIKQSWQYYLKHYNQGRPFVLAGFSQGATAIVNILRDMPDSVYNRMVAAYAIGYKMTQEELDSIPNIKLAKGATDTGVTISFNSVKSPECAFYYTQGTVACINPVNWRTDTVSTSFVNYGRRRNDTLTVKCDPKCKHLLVEGWKKESVMPVLGTPGNYHHMELRFYYPYIRQNIAERLAVFMNKRKE